MKKLCNYAPLNASPKMSGDFTCLSSGKGCFLHAICSDLTCLYSASLKAAETFDIQDCSRVTNYIRKCCTFFFFKSANRCYSTELSFVSLLAGFAIFYCIASFALISALFALFALFRVIHHSCLLFIRVESIIRSRLFRHISFSLKETIYSI